jgi:DNA-binding NarL/FixJ family response regulator
MPQFEVQGQQIRMDIFPVLPMIARLHKEYPETAVIILSQHITSGLAKGIVASGAKGYLVKSDDLSLKLLEAITLINDGGVFYSDAVREALIQKDEEMPLPVLTRRQKEILATIAQSPNDSYSQHAAGLGIAESTLRNHLTNIFKALDVNNIAAALMRSMKLGILLAPEDRGEL